MRTTDDPSQIELPEPSTIDASTDPSSFAPADLPGPFERIATALQVLALATVPPTALGSAFALCPDVGYGTLFFVQIALTYATAISGSSVVMRWLALGASPSFDRSAATPVFAVALAATVSFAARMFDPDIEFFAGAMLTIPFLGVLGVYWSIASTFLARDGEPKRTRRQWRTLDLSLSLLLLGLYAAALRWQIAWAELDEEDAVQTILLWTGSVAGFGLIPFAIDLVCWYAVRSKARLIFLAIGILAFLFGSTWSLSQIAIGNDSEPTAFTFVGSCYLVLSATTAALIAWRPLLPTVRRLDRERFARRESVSPDVSLASSSAKE